MALFLLVLLSAPLVVAQRRRQLNDESPALSTGVVVGVSVAGTALLAAIGFCWFARYRRRQETAFKEDLIITAQQRLYPARRLPTQEIAESLHHSGSALATMSSATLDYGDLDLLRIAAADVVATRKLASGAYGEIFLGEYDGKPVAIKTLLTGHSNRAGIQSFIDEINLLGRLDSPYIVSLIGAAWTRATNLQCVLEFMDLGDLKEFLAKTPSTHFPWQSKLECARNIAEGLVYLHSLRVIHRDLKSRNVLLDSVKGTKLTDFGSSREATTETMTVGVGTYRWMAPEILKYNQYTVAADVYSFGIILSELNTHVVPYSDRTNDRGQGLVDTAIMSMVINDEIRPTFTPECPDWFRELALQCLVHDPTGRPTMMELLLSIGTLTSIEVPSASVSHGCPRWPCRKHAIPEMLGQVLRSLAVAAVASAAQVSLYRGANYTGATLAFPIVWSGNLHEDWAVGFASLRIPGGVEVIGYEHDSFAGASAIWSTDMPDMGNWTDDVSALVIQPAGMGRPQWPPPLMPPPTVASEDAAGANVVIIDNSAGNIELIVGVSVGCTAAVAFVVFYVILKRNKQRERTFKEAFLTSPSHEPSNRANTGASSPSATAGLRWGELDVLRIDADTVVTNSVIASGAYGQVALGTYRNQVVAVKTLLPTKNTRADIQSFIDEINLMGSFQCPYVVELIGVAWTRPSSLQCVLEYMDMGDLKDHLAETTPASYAWSAKLRVAQSIAEGLAYLHSMQIIHRDLKSRNVLLDSVKGTKLTDFGISREDTQETMTIGVGTYRWMAPEILKENLYTVAVDIYSFGMILSELDTHHIPYADLTSAKGKPLVDTAIMGMVIQGTISPSFRPDCPSWLHALALRCIASSPDDRPSALELAHTIKQHATA
ncbi:TKL protein kinase [Saprolegnia diclina VS20]|uniref:TKL protein kinase n=1 Tax=Saprolegnia diclina (strain VS20) TaxID=1156394 RepID=T0QA91_SAPDV|nr:TKL protein kinase [Saprolegnia diclina VS20]EQC30415.1 TKL protein kinase [Saprolegnia diclina VS20]|eukprot:XP_008616268.1 TKL protein kinase [Saprolegnia diclina VS20]